jgi:peptidoglycan-N-acetylglucosamine deacetylase
MTTASRFTLAVFKKRLGHHTLIKGIGTTLGMTLFFVVYFALLRHPAFPPVTVPATRLDDLIGFHPLALIPYVALWPYVALLPALFIDRRELAGLGAGSVVLAVIGLAIFFVWPSMIPDPHIDWTAHPAMLFLKNTDTSGNACPSLHAAFAVFAGLWYARVLPRLGAGWLLQTLNIGLALLIVYSTLGTKQHVALDALFGSLLGAWVASVNFIATPAAENARRRRRPLVMAVVVIKICALLLWWSGIPFGFCLGIFLSGGLLVVYHLLAPAADGLMRVSTRFSTSLNEVWLTLDDGPDPEDTPQILDLLDRYEAKATFFMIGQNAARHPGLVAEVRRRGHDVGHHTQTHPCDFFWCAPRAVVRRELDEALAVLVSTGPAPVHFRSPVGIKNVLLGSMLEDRGMTCIGWSIRSGDSFSENPEEVAARVASRLSPGAIILMHEGPPLKPQVRVQAVAQTLARIQSAGYRCIIPQATSLN